MNVLKASKKELRAELNRLSNDNSNLRRQLKESDELLEELLKSSLLQQYHTAREVWRTQSLEWRMHPKWQALLFRLFDISSRGFTYYIPMPEPGKDMLLSYPVRADSLAGCPELARRRG